jgi:hypothetical protein
MDKSNLELSLIKEKAISYFLGLWDASTGGFRFASHQPATLMSTGYAVFGLELLQGLQYLTEAQKLAIINFITRNVQTDGSFVDPLFRVEDILSKHHNLSYFQEETTTICQQALDALSAPPPPIRNWSDHWHTTDQLIRYFESLSWQDAWMDSNPVMFVLSQLCHDAERHQQPELLTLVDAALDWLDAHQNPETGLWKGPHEVSLTNAMAATFHFTFFYHYRNRPLRYLEQIIDSCLKLQQFHGLFSGKKIGQTCLDYDALDLLAKASLETDYRSEDVEAAMMHAYRALLSLHNEADGGFADCKEQLNGPRNGRKAKLLRKLGLAKLVPLYIRQPATGTYHVCWRLLSCNTAESNAFSTWFRLLGLCLATQKQWLNTELEAEFTFRRLPFLGYINPSSLQIGLNSKDVFIPAI